MKEGDYDLHCWFEAARVNDVKTIEEFIEWGFWTEAKSPLDGMTALMIAAAEESMDCLYLLIAESNINERDEFGNTALLSAASAGKLVSVEALIKAGADIDIENNYGLNFKKALDVGFKKQMQSCRFLDVE